MLKQPLFALLASLFVTTVGCAAAPELETEDQGETQSEQQTQPARGQDPIQMACGSLKAANPACSAEFFVTQLANKASEDVVGAIGAVQDARTCIRNLATIGAVSTAAGPAAPVVLVGAAVVRGIETIAACGSFAMYLSDVGIVDNLRCFFQPQVSTPAYEDCRCTYICTRQGIGVRPPNAGPRAQPVRTHFDYGYVDGDGECQCTDDAAEARGN